MAEEMVSLRCEVCPICQKNAPMKFPRDRLDTGLTGLATLIDIHGLAYSPDPHVRLLYVDEHGSVRSFKVIRELTGDPKILEEISVLKGLY